jgi:cytidylate kinase
MSRGIEQMVNERVLAWEAQLRTSPPPPPPSGVHRTAPVQQPMISISRQCGSRGGDIGRLVAERLSFSFYSQELVHEIATAARVQSGAVESFDEHPRSNLENLVREILDGEAFAAPDYQRYLRAVLTALGRKGRGVVLGRGSHILLEADLTLKVRTYAPFEDRARYTATRNSVSITQAEATVRRVDRERAAFYRQHFDVYWEDPALFDLSINTSRLSLSECADVIVGAYTARFHTTG